MTHIPPCVRKTLDPAIFERKDIDAVAKVLKELGIPGDCLCGQFYLTYNGPFASKNFSHELLDLFEQNENVLDSTRICRSEYAFPSSTVVITSMSGHSVFVYDVEKQCVYDVDFEGGDEALKKGDLQARWNRFDEFLTDFFC